MKGIGTLLAEWLVTGLIVYAGLSGKHLLFIDGPRTAVTFLGMAGFAMCMLMPTIGWFIGKAPAHPLAITGYVLGAAALLTAAAQAFRWGIPVVDDPTVALLVVAGIIAIKSIIGRLAPLMANM